MKNNVLLIGSLFASLSAAFFANGETIEWNGVDQTPYHQEDGSVVFPADTDVTIKPVSPVTITANLTVKGKLTLDTSNVLTTRTMSGYLPGTGQTAVVFPNCKLTDIAALYGTMDGGSMAEARGPDEGCALIGDRTTTSMIVEFQGLETDFVKAAFYTFTQVGDDIAVTGRYCNYGGTSTFGARHSEKTTYLLADEENHNHDFKHYYGERDVSVVLVDKNFTLKGQLAVDGDIEILGRGVVTLSPTADLEIPNKITGLGSLHIAGDESFRRPYRFDTTMTKTPVKIAENAKIEDLIITGGVISGSLMTRSAELNNSKEYPIGDVGMTGTEGYAKEDANPEKGVYFRTVTEAGTITYQLQIREKKALKGLILELQQQGKDIYACTPSAWYWDSNSAAFGSDLTTHSQQKTVGSSGYGLYVLDFTLPDTPIVTVKNDNTELVGSIIVRGRLDSTTGKGLSQNNTILVQGEESELRLTSAAQLSYAHSGLGRAFTLSDGALMRCLAAWSMGYKEWIYTIDSTLAFGDYTGQYFCCQYLENGKMIPLSTKSGIRVGYHRNPETIVGPGTSEIATTVNLFRRSNGEWKISTEGDLLVSGEIHTSHEVSGTMAINKIGAGTLTLAHANSFEDGFTLTEGTVVLADAAAMPKTNALTLSGGILKAADGVSPTCGAVNVAGEAKVVAPKNGVISFEDSSAVTWAEGAKLTIVGPLAKKSIRFGTTKTALTEAQLKAISVEGVKGKILLDADGYLMQQNGMTLSIR